MAILNGFDLIIELPVLYSISSAENFAEGAIKILDSLKQDTYLSFGSEIGDISILDEFAQVLVDKPAEYVSILNHELSTGISFPKARENALLMYLNNIRKNATVLSDSNNILGIEYLKAIKKLKSNITPITIKRTGTGYNSLDFSDNLASATAIRDLILKGENFSNLMPENSYRILEQNIKYDTYIPNLISYEKEILYKLRCMTTVEIAEIADVTEGLENRIKNAADLCNTIEELVGIIKSKRYTMTRIYRILLYILLDIKKSDINLAYKKIPYIRILAINQKGRLLISKLTRANKKLKIISSVKKFTDKNKDKDLKKMLEKDILATNIYTLGYENKSIANLDYTKKIVTI